MGNTKNPPAGAKTTLSPVFHSVETGTEQTHTGDISVFILKSIRTFRAAQGWQHQGAAAAKRQQELPQGNRSQGRKPNPAAFPISPSLREGN